MKSTKEAVEKLKEILTEKEPRRSELIADFHRKIFKEDYHIDETVDEILSELAIDMDFYEPNEEWRKQDHSFYYSEGLEEVIKAGLIKLETITKSRLNAGANE
ncbi:MAG: hypothetical protein ABI113_09530 [Mucilaginibacter sp.]